MKISTDQLYHYCINQLQKTYPLGEAQSLSKILFQDIWNLSLADSIVKKNLDIDENNLKIILKRLKRFEPIQYITGFTYFMNQKYYVNPQVLIPRPETEALTHWIIEDFKWQNPIIWDIGTGSGCIAIALDQNIQNACVFGIDYDKKILDVAMKNNANLNQKVQFHEIDILKTNPNLPTPQVIVSNPPYIPIHEKKEMDKNVVDYEPSSALFVPQDKKLLFYERILDITKFIQFKGTLYFEVHEKYAHDVAVIMKKYQFDTLIKKDINEKNRMIRGTKIKN